MRMGKRILAVLLCAMAVLSIGGWNVYAEEKTGENSLTLENCIPGTEFSLYQVEARDENRVYTVNEKFASYPVNLDLETSEDMRAAASTLSGYVQLDKPEADAVSTADENGVVTFSSLPDGLYLVLGASVVTEATTKTHSPVLAFLPGNDTEGNVLQDVIVSVKQDTSENKTEYTVVKVWSNDTASTRKEIEVKLLQDGEVYGEAVTLSDENSWKHTWEDLPAGHEYKAVEVTKVSGYTVTSTLEGTVFTIRNTKTGTTTTPTPTPTKTTSRLPQTGQLWWPVVILALLGALFLLIGMIRRQSSFKK